MGLRGKFGIVGAALISMGLAGCGLIEEYRRSAEVPAPPPEPESVVMTHPEPPPKMPVPSKRPPRPVSTVAPTALVGNSEGQLVDLLGKPAAVRDEPPAMVWQYVSDSCKVDVFFYFDIKTQGFRTLAYKFYPAAPSTGKADAPVPQPVDTGSAGSVPAPVGAQVANGGGLTPVLPEALPAESAADEKAKKELLRKEGECLYQLQSAAKADQKKKQ